MVSRVGIRWRLRARCLCCCPRCGGTAEAAAVAEGAAERAAAAEAEGAAVAVAPNRGFRLAPRRSCRLSQCRRFGASWSEPELVAERQDRVPWCMCEAATTFRHASGEGIPGTSDP
eukprot:COSAG03_NODE_199_length_10789_cov_369.743312_8_plen_116_part_00